MISVITFGKSVVQAEDKPKEIREFSKILFVLPDFHLFVGIDDLLALFLK
jgi:hypothetical protein